MNETYSSSTSCMDFISFDTPQPPEEPSSSIHMGYQANNTNETEYNISNAELLGSSPSKIANHESNLSERQNSDTPNDISSLWETLRRASMRNKAKNSVSQRLPCNNTRASSNDSSAESLTDIPYDNREESNRLCSVGDKILWLTKNRVVEDGMVAWVGEMDGEPMAGIIFERPVGNNDGVFKHERYFKCAQNHGRFLPVQSLIYHNEADFSHDSKPKRISYEVSAYIQDLFGGSYTMDLLTSTSDENGNSEDAATEEYIDYDTLAVATRPSSSQHFKSQSLSVELNAFGIREEDRHTIKSEDPLRRKSDVQFSHTSNISNSQPPVTLGCIPSGLKLSDRVVWINEKEPVEGTVKWIGRIRGHFHAGDKPVGNSSGLYGYGNGLSKRLFTCKLSYERFIPDHELILYSDYIQSTPNPEFTPCVSLEQGDLPTSDALCENSYGQMVAGNNIDDLLGLNDSDPIGESISSSEMESEISKSRVQQSDTKAETKAKLERIFSNRRHSSATRCLIRETIIRTGSQDSQESIVPSSTSNSTAIDRTSFDILSSQQPANEIQPTKIQHGKIGTNVLAELNRALSQRGGGNNSCSSFGTADNELNIPERTNISTPNYCVRDVRNQNSTTILNATQRPESDLDMNCFKPPSSQSQNRRFSETARQIISLRKSSQLSALRAPAENNRPSPPQQILSGSFSQARFNQESTLPTLKLEDKVVWVTDTKAENGTVKWIGEYNGGTAAGIQFERRIGNTDGKFRGKQHFKCPPNHGGYVPITSLILQSDYYANPSVNLQHSTSTTSSSAPCESLLFTRNNERDDSESSKTLLYCEEDNTIICAICQDSLVKNQMQDGNPKTNGLITTPCGHLFHGYCLTKWFSTKPNVTMRECPNCMKTMNIAAVIRIFPSVGKP